MTDKELLELAAKASGFDDANWDGKANAICTTKLPGFRCFWNPLVDDGDALRLAVKLGLDIQLHGMLHIFQYGQVTSVENHIDGPDTEFEVIDGDQYVATRRAIVRAAAEIGKDLK